MYPSVLPENSVRKHVAISIRLDMCLVFEIVLAIECDFRFAEMSVQTKEEEQ